MNTGFREVADILLAIAAPPRRRKERRPGDVQGAYDEWFDGGAIKTVTGWKEYHFANGTVAIVHATLTLRADIRLPTGGFVIVTEQAGAPPFWPVGTV